MNNCCGFEYADGGTSKNATIIDARIISPAIQSVAMTGGVELDDATATDIANRLCPLLKQCIQDTINKGTLENMTLSNTILEDGVTLDADSAKDIADSICQYLTNCIVGAVENNELNGVKITDGVLTTPSVKGGITLDADTAKAVADAVVDLLKDRMVKAVEESGLDKTELRDPIIKGAGTSIDADAAKIVATAVQDLLAKYVKEKLEAEGLDGIVITNATLNGGMTMDQNVQKAITDLVETYFKVNGLSGITLKGPSIDGAITLDDNALNGLLASLDDGIKKLVADEVNAALTEGTICCIHIKGAQIDKSSGSNNTFTDTTLNGTTHIDGELVLGDEVLGNLCAQLQTCIRTAIEEWLKLTPVAAADQPATTIQDELPTSIIGGRDALLGKPDGFIRIGDWQIPAWKA